MPLYKSLVGFVKGSDYYAKDGLSSQVTTVQGKNLFDKNRATLGKFIAITTGSLLDDATSASSDYIPVTPNSAYFVNANITYSGAGIAYYDTNKSLLSCTNKSAADINISFITSATTAFIRVSLNTYDVNIDNIQIELGSAATVYEAFVPNSPSPEYPSAITSNLAAGTYKYTSTDGIYEFTLADALRGIGTALDKVVFDRVSHNGILETKNARIASYNGESITASYLSTTGALTTGAEVVYQLATPTTAALAFAKVASSAATEVPMVFLTSTPSDDYPVGKWIGGSSGSAILTAGTTTTITDATAKTTSTILLSPTSLAVIALTPYVSTKSNGSFVITTLTAAGTESLDWVLVN